SLLAPPAPRLGSATTPAAAVGAILIRRRKPVKRGHATGGESRCLTVRSPPATLGPINLRPRGLGRVGPAINRRPREAAVAVALWRGPGADGTLLRHGADRSGQCNRRAAWTARTVVINGAATQRDM